MMALVAAGIGFLLAGLLAIVFGIPVKEFSFGNTLILCGAIGVGTGAILLGLASVVRELKAMSRGGLSVGASDTPRLPARPRLAGSGQSEPQPATDGPLFSRDQPQPERAAPDIAAPQIDVGAEPSWQSDAVERDPPPPAEPTPPPAEPPKVRRNLLFSSSSRKERERLARGSEPDAAGSPTSPILPDSAAPAEPKEPSPRTFDQAWPEPRPRLDPALRRPSPPPAEPAEPAAPETGDDSDTSVTVLKSGVVDGMEYSLYSDGSIETVMPEGKMRFASIDELRSHLDQRPS